MKILKPVLLFLLIALTSCTSLKKIVYIQDEDDSPAHEGTYPEFVLRINPNDILSIQVFTVNAEAFPGIASTVDKQVIDNRSAYEKGFIVDGGGYVELPLIGKVILAGLSMTEARDTLVNRFSFYMDDPVIMIKKLSFKITVLGEVNHPGLFYVPNEKVKLLEALGMAGDLTTYANHREIKIVRTTNGTYREIIVDLTTKQPLNSEVAYLYPDDIVYVKPVRRRDATTITPTLAIITSIIASIALIISVAQK